MTMKLTDGTPHQEYFNKEHNLFRKAASDFVKKEIIPYIDNWEEQGGFPRELYNKAGELGFLGIGFPEALGGTPGDIFLSIVMNEELMRSGSGGLTASLGSHCIGLPPIVNQGTLKQQKKFVVPALKGEKISALAVTEPSGGSDVASIKTTAVREGNEYLVNGSKTFITSGTRADYLTCAVRTGEEGARGISFILIESDTPGYSTSSKFKKTGWWASDTAEIFFDNCSVPVENLIGEENSGFSIIMENFQMERLQLCIMANMTAQLAFEASLEYSKKRDAFGKKLKGFQVTRHKLAEMATLIEVSREFTYRIAAKINAGENQVKEISMAKNFACKTSDQVTYDAVQIFGGYGFMRGYPVERLYRDNRILSIGGGTTEIMNEIISAHIL